MIAPPFRLARRVYAAISGRLDEAFVAGADDDRVALFDALQQDAFDLGGWVGLARCWAAESRALAALAVTRRGQSSRRSIPMWSLRSDVRDAWRSLRHAPAYASMVILMLALGIGINTAVFSVTDALLFKALPYTRADRLVLVTERPLTGGNWTVAPTMFGYWRRVLQSTRIEARMPGNVTLLDGGDPEDIRGARVTPGYFDLLGAPVARGRGFLPSDGASEAPCVAVVSHRLFDRRLAGDDRRLGQPLHLGGRLCTLIGVLPADSVFDRGAPEVYTPLVLSPSEAQSNGRMLTVIGRLRDGASVDQATAELATTAAAFNATRGPAGRDWTASALPWRDILIRTDARQLVWVLFAAVGVVLVIACTNIAGLALSRGLTRQREVAVRAALGAGRARLFRAMLTESVLLALVGGLVSVLVGAGALRALVALIPPGTLPVEVTPTLDVRAILFTLAVATVTGIVSGALPAWQAGDAALTTVLAASGRGTTTSRRASWLQSGLLVAELALAMVLVTGSSLLIVSFARLVDVSPGFDPSKVLALRLSPSGPAYGTDAQLADFYTRVRHAIAAVPTVDAVGGATSLPLGGWLYGSRFRVDGVTLPDPQPSVHLQSATPGYFEALRIAVSEGRTFTDRDDAGAPKVAIVNETFVRKFVQDGRVIGRRLWISDSSSSASDPGATIVGVIRNVKTAGLDDGDLATPEVYLPHAQAPVAVMFLAIRATAQDPMAIAPDVRAAVRSVDAALAAPVVRMTDRLDGSVAPQRFRTAIIAVFAGLAVLLACLGVYAVRSRAVAARRRELGIRVALGATTGQVVRMTLGQGVRLAALGLGVGLTLTWALTGYVRPWLFAVQVSDPRILVAAVGVLGGAAMLASWIPARRAAGVDPISVLRDS